jgi:hypothetical protein
MAPPFVWALGHRPSCLALGTVLPLSVLLNEIKLSLLVRLGVLNVALSLNKCLNFVRVPS